MDKKDDISPNDSPSKCQHIKPHSLRFVYVERGKNWRAKIKSYARRANVKLMKKEAYKYPLPHVHFV